MSHLPDVYAIVAIEAANAVDYSQVGETSIEAAGGDIRTCCHKAGKWYHNCYRVHH